MAKRVISKGAKRIIVKAATLEHIAEKRDAALRQLSEDLTVLAGRMFDPDELRILRRHEGSYVSFTNHLYAGHGFKCPAEFYLAERSEEYSDWGFCDRGCVCLNESFPVQVNHYQLRLREEDAPEYLDAVRKYMLVFFEGRKVAGIVGETLAAAGTYKQLEELAPELLRFCPAEELPKQLPVSMQTIERCRALFAKPREGGKETA